MLDHLGGNEADAANVGVAVFLAEAQSPGEVRPYDIAVEYGDPTPALHKPHRQRRSRGGLPGPAQAGEPHAYALFVAWGAGFCQYL